MQQFEGNLEHFNPNNPFAGDEKVPVQFYMGVIQDQAASQNAGRPIFKDAEYIKIYNSKDNIIDRPVRDMDKQRWPGQYAAWKNTGESSPGAVGTRLEFWPQVTRAQAEEMKHFKVFTVEQLAELPDSQGQNIMNFQRLKALAKAYVVAAKEAAPIAALQAKLDEQVATNASLQDQIDKLVKKIERMQAKAA